MAATDRGNRDTGRSPNHATVIAWLALFVALGGVANGIQGIDNISGRNIREGAVRTSEIKDAEVKQADLGPGAVTTGALADGAVGPGQLGPIPAARVDTPAQDPGCTAQVIENAQTEVLQFSVEAFDTRDLHADGSEECAAGTQSRLTAPIDGLYAVNAQVTWPADQTGERDLTLLKTDSTPAPIAVTTQLPIAGGATQQTASSLAQLAAGDYVEARVFHSAGINLTLNSQLGNHLSMAWIGPLP